jgi:hypothetical protein
MIQILKISLFAALMAGFILGTSIKEKRAEKKAKIEKAK